MTDRCIHIDPCKDKRWDRFVTEHKLGSLYHDSRWAEVIMKSYGYHPEYLALVDDSKTIIAALPLFVVKSPLTGRRIVSVPFADSCGQLTTKPADSAELFRAVGDLSAKLLIPQIEIRTKCHQEYLLSTGHSSVKKHKTHLLKLCDDPENLKDNFNRKTISDIAKGEKSGLSIRFAEDENDLKCFYNLYAETRKFHGLLPQPYRFFSSMWSVYKKSESIDVVFAMDGKKAIAGILLIKYRDTVYFLYAGMDRKKASKRPAYFLLWRAITLACEKKYAWFDFGRTHGDNQGLLTFKRRWGTEEQDIWSFNYGGKENSKLLINRNDRLVSLVKKNCKRVPLPLLKIAGEIIYKHIG